ncbi:hypothetical protein QQS21_012027 [Conoideocrella luteorostrata]|uniref:Peptidase S8/S53 domain-containing protein n=1 Tax=Conoideocrella luteorostrata TaxID=1105319 RepID=A0AAJ0CC98_9HYPO|nr:hypothetical protein QQS21_012027 [Conoideocrella luteorostrata]
MKTNDTTALNNAIASITTKPSYIYASDPCGFSASLTTSEVSKLTSSPTIERVSPDEAIQVEKLGETHFGYKKWSSYTFKQRWRTLFYKPASIKPEFIELGQGMVAQHNAPWNLARISHGPTNWDSSYVFHKSAGTGTCVYVLDSGIDANHPEFGGRASLIQDFFHDKLSSRDHGTIMAGIIGSATYGVAKNTTLFVVKISYADGKSSFAHVLAGLQFVKEDAPSRYCPNGIVVNLSLQWPARMDMIDLGVKGLVRAGFFVVASAGNNRRRLRGEVPATTSGVCTVGATTVRNGLARYSSYGPEVDLLAPGTSIASVKAKRHNKPSYSSGTSASAAHVSGLGAYLLGRGYKAKDLCKHMRKMGLHDIIVSRKRLDYNNNILINNGNKD